MSNIISDEIFVSGDLPEGLEKLAQSEEGSEVSDEIFDRRAGFFERSAIYFFFGLVLLGVLGSVFVKYPDYIEGMAVLVSESSPREIVANSSGKLAHIFFADNSEVRENDIIGYIDNTADFNEVFDLKALLDSVSLIVERRRLDSMMRFYNRHYSDLGELQDMYQKFLLSWQIYNDYLVNGYYRRKRGFLLNDIAAIEKINGKTEGQKQNVSDDNELAKKTFQMNEILFKEKVLSAEEYRQAQSILLNKINRIGPIESSIINGENSLRDKQRQVEELDHELEKERRNFTEDLLVLKSGINSWIKKYVLLSPVAGRLVFPMPLQKNGFVSQGKIVGYVKPNDTKVYARLKLDQINLGKVDTGMKVWLRFEAYPFEESGSVLGRLSYLTEMSIDSGFLGRIDFPNGLVTDQNRNLKFRDGLKARALVVTRDVTLFRKLYRAIVKSTSLVK